jgi:hypothetical protein
MTSQPDLSLLQYQIELIPNGTILKVKWIASNVLRLIEDKSLNESEKLQLILLTILNFKKGKIVFYSLESLLFTLPIIN